MIAAATANMTRSLGDAVVSVALLMPRPQRTRLRLPYQKLRSTSGDGLCRLLALRAGSSRTPASQLSGVDRTNGEGTSDANDPEQTKSNYSAAIRPRRIYLGRDLVPDNVDVAAQVVHLVREGQRKLDMADGILNALDFSLLPS